MRRRANRIAIFAAVVAGHLLALHFFPDFRSAPELAEQEISLPITLLPPDAQRPNATLPRKRMHSPHQTTAASNRRKALRSEHEQQAARPTVRPQEPRSTRSWVDWQQEADAATADRAEHAAESARRGSALSRWREHVMPGPPPRRPEFRWDYAATHRIESAPGRGLVININDRCFVVVTGLFVLPVCRIGEIPAYGDLFAHMDDPQEPGASALP